MEQRLRKGAARWLASYGLLGLQDHQPRDGAAHNRLGLSHQSRTKKIAYSRSYGGIFSAEPPFSQVTMPVSS